ncbi:MAG: OB-fold nucleic acid binding domain-containing protein, partial [Acidobacteriota bacterium]
MDEEVDMSVHRSAECGRLGVDDEGRDVVIGGWVHRRRDHGNLIFIDLRDRSGIAQVVVRPERSSQAHAVCRNVRNEFVLIVSGTVVRRGPENVNPDIPTGEIEVVARHIEVLNSSDVPPFPLDGP